ncbi:uncharacterized protein LOC109724379 isoform X1 [Ananas comosus]|uniref:Uncharacterized protein LOC109724379 isoform X1 n=1 Tax=Ananas comosus TaxID=4615 RepID=A0A6P5GLD5_ANACO|nr:uncharacterized protein LOC109724379 isoform X1 [Ananas comosus]
MDLRSSFALGVHDNNLSFVALFSRSLKAGLVPIQHSGETKILHYLGSLSAAVSSSSSAEKGVKSKWLGSRPGRARTLHLKPFPASPSLDTPTHQTPSTGRPTPSSATAPRAIPEIRSYQVETCFDHQLDALHIHRI